MANPVPSRGDVSAGTYLDVDSTQHLPPCRRCGNREWETESGGDFVHDPYPDR
jgi:hypothetical protein